jgi:hypothetical protein
MAALFAIKTDRIRGSSLRATLDLPLRSPQMPRMRRHTNRNRKSSLIEHAMATLLTNQAAFLSQLAENNKARAQADLRFARIERDLDEIKALLLRHDRVLAKLPDAVSRKIGFKSK